MNSTGLHCFFSPIEKKEQLEDSRPVSENVTPFHGRTFTGEDFGNVSSLFLRVGSFRPSFFSTTS